MLLEVLLIACGRGFRELERSHKIKSILVTLIQSAQLAKEKLGSGINGSQKVVLGVSAKIAARASQYE